MGTGNIWRFPRIVANHSSGGGEELKESCCCNNYYLFIFRCSGVSDGVVLFPVALVHAHHSHRVWHWKVHQEVHSGVVQQANWTLLSIPGIISRIRGLLSGVSCMVHGGMVVGMVAWWLVAWWIGGWWHGGWWHGGWWHGGGMVVSARWLVAWWL